MLFFLIFCFRAIDYTVKLQNAVLIKGTNKVKIDLSTLAAGIYFLKIENNGESFIKKVVKN